MDDGRWMLHATLAFSIALSFYLDLCKLQALEHHDSIVDKKDTLLIWKEFYMQPTCKIYIYSIRAAPTTPNRYHTKARDLEHLAQHEVKTHHQPLNGPFFEGPFFFTAPKNSPLSNRLTCQS